MGGGRKEESAQVKFYLRVCAEKSREGCGRSAATGKMFANIFEGENKMKTTRMLAILVLALGLASVSLAVEGTWTRKTDMPTARWGLSTCVVDGKIYAIGGGKTPYGAYLSIVEEYDPATDTWTTKADMPTERAFQSSSVVNGKIYAIGGAPGAETDTPVVEEYDPAMDTWTRKADMPTARCFLSTSVVNGKIYAIGGWKEPENLPLSAVEEYDPATDTWTRKADMPEARFALSTSVIDGKIYAIGGIVASHMSGSAVSTVEEYDPATDSWTANADMPTARTYLSTCVVNGKIYAIGGTRGGSVTRVLSTVEAYDPAADTWTTKADMSTARDMFSTSVVNGKIYAIGGSVQYWPWTPTSKVEEYDPNPIVVDFNGDEIVDIDDLLILIEHWGQDDPMCDIAPRPFGDGIVDVADLEVLMSYWQQEVLPVSLLAYWKLDETEGDIAYDSIGVYGYDGVLNGVPTWQPTGGAVDGALAFDGIDDYVSTPFVLNPVDGAFSVFAWIKDGAPGQAIISQADGAFLSTIGSTWLSTDPAGGKLMTELKSHDRAGSGPLVSQTVITDGYWHRVGLVWDGSYRALYVDDVEVATDVTFPGAFQSAEGGLYFGAGNSLDAGSFWSGLIDDVRIYNRAVTP